MSENIDYNYEENDRMSPRKKTAA